MAITSKYKLKKSETIPLFFAVDDAYAPFLAVTLKSISDNLLPKDSAAANILINELSDENKNKLKTLETENLKINFVDVSSRLEKIKEKLHIRDYYTNATYYRFFIPAMFPEYDKGIYLDSDIVVTQNISKLYNVNLNDNLVGAVTDEIITEIPTFAEYSEKFLGIPKTKYFNAGILVMNLKALREINIEEQLMYIMKFRQFTVAQDQDYLNVLCYNKVEYLNGLWNKTPFENCDTSTLPFIIHFKINWKPWHYSGVSFEEQFWKYAKNTEYYTDILNIKNNYTNREVLRDKKQYDGLVQLAKNEVQKTLNPNYMLPLEYSLYKRELNMEKSKERLEILEKIKEYESQGIFDRDVEDDPPTIPLKSGDVDYLGKKFSTRFLTRIANVIAKTYFDNLIKKNELIIRGVTGYENFLSVADRGVIITSNHFHPFDNYAIFKVFESKLGKKRLYKIIREGNYTNFKGLYGFFFRHCNTLPLCSNLAVWRELQNAIDTLLQRGEKILIFPEQAMWWNYKKPRPLKSGAFRFAAKSSAPVLPIFISMEDSEKIGADGFPVQAYTLHIMPPIYPKENLSVKANAEYMCATNYNMLKEKYEEVYKIPLKYGEETEEKTEKICSTL